MRLKYRKILITILFVIEILLVNLTYQSFLHKEINKEENKITKKQFAMYIKENEDYVEYKGDNLFPKGYYVNKSLSKCVDEKGNLVENAISSIGNSVTITSNKTVYCTLYFDKNAILEYLRSKDTNCVLSEDVTGGMYRYQGVYTDEINNYICLGDNCCTNENCPADDNDDMYRIIGINDNGEMKVIKKTALTDSVKWWSDQFTNIKWPQSLIYQKLNGKSEESTASNLNDPNSYYYGLDKNLKNIIITNYNWLYGDTTDGGTYNGDQIYGIESGNSKALYNEKTDTGSESLLEIWSDTVEAPIGLMYLSDYYYAYKTNDLDAGNPGSYSKAVNSWIHLSHNESSHPSDSGGHERTMSRYGLYPTENCYFAWRVNVDSFVNGDYLNDKLAVRPTFYLKSDIELFGEGTIKDPFKIITKDSENNKVYGFGYTGDYQTFNVPEDGTYKIELWGASGGDFEGYNGGKGAYTSGNINLNKGEYLYIYVGESGNTKRIASFNGGGANNDLYGAGGGGASDVRLTEEKWNNFESLKSRIMVAAGGGGANNRNISNFMGGYYFGAGKGGSGGALVGGDGESLDETHTNPENSMSYGWTYGKGASQEAGGEIENYCNTCNSKTVDDYSGTGQFGYAETGQSGGGSGYYAGGSSLHGGGGGGSSYISGYPGCKAITKESTESNITHSDSPDHYSDKVFSDPVMIAGNDTMPSYNGGSMIGNTGNGYARITKIK